MEKTKLVRTFGTALATATLSFGLFVPTALADKQEVTGTAVIVTEEGNDDVAEAGENVLITIPATVDVDFTTVEGGVMTFTATDGTHEQEVKILFEKDKATKMADVKANQFKFKYDKGGNDQTVITDFMAKLTVDEDMLTGTWELKDIKLYKTAVTLEQLDYLDDDDELATLTSDVSFKVEGTDDPQDMALDLESIITKKVVYRNKGNKLFVTTKGNFGDHPSASATATYVNPAGEEKEYDYTGKEGHTYRFDDLNTQVDGYYTLKSLKLKDAGEQIKGKGGNYGMLYNAVTYDDYAILSDGDYEVTLTGVEAMIRLYNPWTGEHIYTNDPVEAVAAVVAGWTDEGIAWYAPVNGLYPDAVSPVYRVYNQYNGEHHYTTSSVEALALVAAGWTDEGTGFYTTTKGDKKAQAVYRLFNPYATVGTHHYTTGLDEYNDLQTAGWKGEGVGWYGVKVDLDD